MQLGTLVSNTGLPALMLGCLVHPCAGRLLARSNLVPLVEVDGQQTAGGPGSPNATTTLAGRCLPQGLYAAHSKSSCSATVVPPEGAPNILPIMTNDVGLAAAHSIFGGVIPRPILNRIIDDGLPRTNLHATALRSPTRAALITVRRR
jgi:hypothetical protein